MTKNDFLRASRVVPLLAVLMLVLPVPAQNIDYEGDLKFFCETIGEQYAYFDKKQTDWSRVSEIYRPSLGGVKDRATFVRLLETILRELYDDHVQLNTNLPDSQRLVPTGSDLRAEWRGDRAVITDLRRGFGSERAGLRVGMQLVRFNGIPIENAIAPFIGKTLRTVDTEVKNWALNMVLAGDHITKREIAAKDGATIRLFYPDESRMFQEDVTYDGPIEHRMLNGDIGYIRINNSLGDNALIALFDQAVQEMMGSRGLILDLRETPSGGNSTVARAIIGRFVENEAPYQKHSDPSEEAQTKVRRSWLELVSSRPPVCKMRVVVLVNAWTGSMGEGIAIGFDALKRATIVGMRMGGLNGAMTSFELPSSKIRFSIPTEKVFHVNGQPRESFLPSVRVENIDILSDNILLRGMKELGDGQ